MNGGQDLGGMMGFGPVIPEDEKEIFHGDWERTAFALTLAMGSLGRWNIDAIRQQRESLSPGEYLTTPYYGIWIKALEQLLLKDGLVSESELKAGRRLDSDGPQATRTQSAPAITAVTPAQVSTMLARGTQYARTPDTEPRFAVGQHVITDNGNPVGHTRLPRYARAKRGVIERVAGFFVFPDTSAAGEGDQPQWLYTVTFDAPTLWGKAADPSLTISIDAWESYLEQA